MVNSRRKGARVERELVRLLQKVGFAAEKVSRSGYTGHDLTLPVLGKDRPVEVKARQSSFGTLYKWLEPVEFLIVKDDRKEPLVVLRLKDAVQYARIAETAQYLNNVQIRDASLKAIRKTLENARLAESTKDASHQNFTPNASPDVDHGPSDGSHQPTRQVAK